jgi:hypothetical protein
VLAEALAGAGRDEDNHSSVDGLWSESGFHRRREGRGWGSRYCCRVFVVILEMFVNKMRQTLLAGGERFATFDSSGHRELFNIC